MHPRGLRCSFLKYSRYSRSSRLARGAPRPSRCDARLSPRAASPAVGPVKPGSWLQRACHAYGGVLNSGHPYSEMAEERLAAQQVLLFDNGELRHVVDE